MNGNDRDSHVTDISDKVARTLAVAGVEFGELLDKARSAFGGEKH